MIFKCHELCVCTEARACMRARAIDPSRDLCFRKDLMAMISHHVQRNAIARALRVYRSLLVGRWQRHHILVNHQLLPPSNWWTIWLKMQLHLVDNKRLPFVQTMRNDRNCKVNLNWDRDRLANDWQRSLSTKKKIIIFAVRFMLTQSRNYEFVPMRFFAYPQKKINDFKVDKISRKRFVWLHDANATIRFSLLSISFGSRFVIVASQPHQMW